MTAVLDPANLGGPEAELAYKNLRRTGARFVRMFVNWAHVRYRRPTKPAGFDAREPWRRVYRWESLDAQVRKAVAEGFAPIVYVQTAPLWAQSCSARTRPRVAPAQASWRTS